MNCKHCNQSNCIKRGKRGAAQRYFCKKCKRSFQNSYVYSAYEPSTNDLIVKLLKECCGVRGISRVIGIATKTVLSRILQLSVPLKPPHFPTFGCKFEVDEMWTFIHSKSNVT